MSLKGDIASAVDKDICLLSSGGRVSKSPEDIAGCEEHPLHLFHLIKRRLEF